MDTHIFVLVMNAAPIPEILIWQRTGEEVNHQWGKSSEAQRLLNDYIRMNLVANCTYFSILKPIYDVLIFNLLAQDLEPRSIHIHAIFKTRGAGVVQNVPMSGLTTWLICQRKLGNASLMATEIYLICPKTNFRFRQMLGLEAHTPFECIGQIDEVRLAFELCKRKGLKGAAMQVFEREVPPVDVPGLLERYLQVDESIDTLPEVLQEKVIAQMRAAAAKVRNKLSRDENG